MRHRIMNNNSLQCKNYIRNKIGQNSNYKYTFSSSRINKFCKITSFNMTTTSSIISFLTLTTINSSRINKFIITNVMTLRSGVTTDSNSLINTGSISNRSILYKRRMIITTSSTYIRNHILYNNSIKFTHIPNSRFRNRYPPPFFFRSSGLLSTSLEQLACS